MALAKMRKLTLVALTSDKERLFDEIVRSGAVEFGQSAEIEYCVKTEDKDGRVKIEDDIRRLESAMRILSENVDAVNSDVKGKKGKIELPKAPMTRPKKEFTFEEFKNISSITEEVFSEIEQIEKMNDRLTQAFTQESALSADYKKYYVYISLNRPFSYFADTNHAFIAAGTVPVESFPDFANAFKDAELASFDNLGENTGENLVTVVCHKSQSSFFSSLSQYGFKRCEISSDEYPTDFLNKIKEKKAALEKEIKIIKAALVFKLSSWEKFKSVNDFLSLEHRKFDVDKEFAKTDKTFVAFAYVPEKQEDSVKSALLSVTEDAIVYFEDVADGEFAPTLCENNSFVSSFESVTNMYTPPSYHEPDPNPVMSVFYFLIFGLMTADIGYGLLLAIGGLTASALIKQNTGVRQLARLFGVSGFATIFWGMVFGSFFSADIAAMIPNCPLWYPLLPSPLDFPIITMILSLALGILHIMGGVAANAYKLGKRKDRSGVVFDALNWEIFFVGLIVLALQPACQMIMENCKLGTPDAVKQPQILALQAIASNEKLVNIGLMIMGFALLVVLFTAGRRNKGILGKIKGGLGGIYGVINYFSDVVSYVRIFGLMLSGAVFGLIVNQISGMLMNSIPGYIAAVVVMIFFHLFNLVLAVLGAYVHNARLQYVEFFGKFYEGDGELFVPFGSDLENTLIKTADKR